MKPGYKTTEFWVTGFANIVAAVVSILAFRGLMSSAEADLWVSLGQAIIGTAAPLAAAFVTGRYINSRTEAKKNGNG